MRLCFTFQILVVYVSIHWDTRTARFCRQECSPASLLGISTSPDRLCFCGNKYQLRVSDIDCDYHKQMYIYNIIYYIYIVYHVYILYTQATSNRLWGHPPTAARYEICCESFGLSCPWANRMRPEQENARPQEIWCHIESIPQSCKMSGSVIWMELESDHPIDSLNSFV